MYKNNIFLTYVIVCVIAICCSLYTELLLASTGNPLESIKTHIEDTIKTIVTIVQILGVLALATFVGYSWWSGNFDKGRLIMIIVGIIILAAAKPIVSFITTWIK